MWESLGMNRLINLPGEAIANFPVSPLAIPRPRTGTQGLKLNYIMPVIPAKYSIVTPTPDAGQLNSHAFALDIHGLHMNIF